MIVALVTVALADPSPAPSPSPTPTPHFELHGIAASVFIDQATNGPGQIPPEGAAFIGGFPAAPMTPFDWFVTTPSLPGAAGQIQYAITPTWHWSKFSGSLTLLLSGIQGDSNNGLYWGEPLVGNFDPHEGRNIINYGVAYPTGPGTANTSSALLELPYSASLNTSDGRLKITGGFVQTSHYDPFVFSQPFTPSWTPTMNLQTYETVGPGLTDLDSWHHFATALPIKGVDATGTVGAATIEATFGVLPGPLTTAAHMSAANVVFDKGDAGRYSLNLVHVQTSGDPIVIPSFYGSSPTINGGPQGKLALSTLGNQRQTLLGGRAFFHPRKGYDATIELGRSWYDADMVAQPGTAAPGNYQHYALTRHFNATDDAGIEFYRMDPRYATMFLPDGIFENVFGFAWVYPGPWLKGAYQLVNDSFGGSNRRGFRGHADFKRGPFSLSAAMYEYRQISPSTWDNLTQTGFVEVDYLVLGPGPVSYGHTRGVSAYFSYQHARDTLSVDFANDAQHRDAPSGPLDGVDTRYPQMVVAEQHRFSPHFIANLAYERYHASGVWAATPLGDTFAAGILGGEFDFGRAGQLFVQVRRYGVWGTPSLPGGPPPTLTGTQLVVDHHFTF